MHLFKTKSYFEYVYGPGNEYLPARFGAAMNTFATAESETVVPGGSCWNPCRRGRILSTLEEELEELITKS